MVVDGWTKRSASISPQAERARDSNGNPFCSLIDCALNKGEANERTKRLKWIARPAPNFIA